MNALKLAIQFLKNNMKTYGFYLCVIITTIAIYYNFLAVQHNPVTKELADVYQNAKVASILCAMILFWVVIFFMWHSNNFFFKQRQKETGLYMLMGVTSSKIGKVFALESIALGGLAFAIGLPVGILFSKLFFMLLAKAMILNTALPFNVPMKAVIQLFITFTTIFLILGIRNYVLVKKSKLIELINAAKKQQVLPNMKYIRGFLGVIFIAAGYILAFNINKWRLELLSTSMGILVIVCVGTYFLFGSFLAIVMKKLIEHKSLVYKGSRLISFSNILFRAGNNYKNLAMTAILSASAVTAFGTALSLSAYADNNMAIEVPYSVNYLSNDAKVQQKVEDEIKQSKHEIKKLNQSKFLILGNDKKVITLGDTSYKGIESITKDKNSEYIVTSYSEIKKGLEAMDYKNKEKLLEKIKVESGEVILMPSPRVMGSTISEVGKETLIGNKKYTIKEKLKIPFVGETCNLAGYYGYVLNDGDYAALKGDKEEIINNGIVFTDQEDSLELIYKLIEIVPGGMENINAYMGQYAYKYYLIGSMYFLGIIMAIVFILTTFSTLYFKVLSDALSDKMQYEMLKKVGMTKEEVLKSVYIQVGTAFALPALVGAVHSFAAIKVLEQFVMGSYIMQYGIAMGLFVVIMLGYYMAISKKYFNMVYEA